MQAKISDTYLDCEKQLKAKSYRVTRLVKNDEVFALQVVGDFHDMQNIRDIFPNQFVMVLNPNSHTITIKTNVK